MTTFLTLGLLSGKYLGSGSKSKWYGSETLDRDLVEN